MLNSAILVRTELSQGPVIVAVRISLSVALSQEPGRALSSAGDSLLPFDALALPFSILP